MAREVPIQDFFKDPEFTCVSSRRMASTWLSPCRRRTARCWPCCGVSDQGVVGKWDYGENRHFRRRAVWANNERLLFCVGFKTGSFDFEVGKGDLYASNIDGSGRIDIPNGAYYDIVDLTPDDPDTILVERSVESAFLFKLNVNNGRLTTVATAPVRWRQLPGRP